MTVSEILARHAACAKFDELPAEAVNAAIVPAVLAAGESGKVSGKDAIAAIVLGGGTEGEVLALRGGRGL